MSALGRRRRFMIALALGVLATFLVELCVGLRIGGAKSARDLDDAATALAVAIATACCARAAGQHRGRMRLFWGLLAGACACWTLAELTWAVYDVILAAPPPVPSWADLGYLTATPLAVAALVSHPAMHRARSQRARYFFDGLLIATALLFLSWTLVLGPLWHHTDLSTLGGVVTLAYPFGDVVVAFFILLAVRRMRVGDRLALWCLLGGLLAMALSDSTYSYLVEANRYSTGSLLDAGWVAAYLGIALAAYSSDPERRFVLKTPPPLRASLRSFLVPFTPAVLALLVVGIELQLGNHLDRASRMMAFALVILVLGRQAVLATQLRAPRDGPEARWLKQVVRVALGRGAIGIAGHRDRRSGKERR